MSTRVKWIDTAKALGAIYVIFGHFLEVDNITNFIYAFHMPLFFMLSGITFYAKENENCRSFLYKKFKAILIPYLILSLPGYLYDLLMNIKHHVGSEKLIKQFLGIFLNIKRTDFENGLWFLTSIYLVYVIAYFMAKYIKDKRVFFIVTIALFFVGTLFVHFGINLPWGLDTSLIAYLFFAIGYLCKDYIYKIKSYWCLCYLPVFCLSLVVYRLYGYRLELYKNQYGNYIIFIVAGLLGCFATVGLANIKLLSDNEKLSLIGRESLFLYGAQMVIVSIYAAAKYKIWGRSIFLCDFIVAILVLVLLMVVVRPIYYKIYNWILRRL